MIFFGAFVLIFTAVLLPSASSLDGPCERIENYAWASLGTLKTCHMKTIVIDSKDFSITSDRDETVKGFYAHDNKQLKHLPNNLGAKFPSLIGLNAAWCSIKEVPKGSFRDLNKLRGLWLYKNQIEKIDDDTFEFIPAIEEIHLDFNKIKKLNGRAFASLHKLTRVDLSHNECVSENFATETRIAELPRVATERCGFVDPEPLSAETAKLEADLSAKSEELQALRIQYAKLETKAELQMAHHNEVKAQLKETCDARIELKAQEIYHCSNDLQVKSAEINEKNEKIRQCEKKNQILGGDGP